MKQVGLAPTGALLKE
jgi:hypothetical protein